MTISFILSIYSVDEKLEKTLNSIFQQKSKDYEVIIVDEESSNNTITKLNTYFQKYYKYIKIITSLNEITTSIGWNLALKHASGQYVLFLQPGYELNESFISDLKQDIYDHNSPDLLEFLVQYTNVYNHISTRRLKNNHLYKPLNDPEVFAFIHHSLFNKVFSRQLIISNSLFFRLTSRFDLLFIYSFLPLAQNLYSSNKVLLTIPIEPMLTFNSFDFLKQWSHIYNYYKKINLQTCFPCPYTFPETKLVFS